MRCFCVGSVCLEDLYKRIEFISDDEIPYVDNEYEHIQGRRIRFYVKKKLARLVKEDYAPLNEILLNAKKIKIVGVFDKHLLDLDFLQREFGLKKLEPLPPCEKRRESDLYIGKMEGPRIYRIDDKEYIVAVFPGREYLIHIASLIKTYLALERKLQSVKLEVIRYPIAEKKVYYWTGISDLWKSIRISLHEWGINRYVLLLGHYVFLERLLDFLELDATYIYSDAEFENRLSQFDIFIDYRNAYAIIFFQFRYYYWGNIIGNLARGFYSNGVKYIIHIANAGSIRNPNDIVLPFKTVVDLEFGYSAPEVFDFIYELPTLMKPNRLFWGIHIPLIYAYLDGDRLRISTTLNSIVTILSREGLIPPISSLHLCVRTPIEELYNPFVMLATYIGATSVDAEAFHIAEAANRLGGDFGSIYIASDYVRKHHADVNITLANMSREAKHRIYHLLFHEIAKNFFVPYIQTIFR